MTNQRLKSDKAFSRKRLQTRQNIEQATAALIKELGYDAVSMELIARRANMARSTLYTHYTSKDNIVKDFVYTFFVSAEEALRQLDHSTPEDTFTKLLYLYCTLYDNFAEQMQVVQRVQRAIFDDPTSPWQRFVQDISEIIERLRLQGRLRVSDTDTATRLLFRTAIPTLEVLQGTQNFEHIFVGSIKGYIFVE